MKYLVALIGLVSIICMTPFIIIGFCWNIVSDGFKCGIELHDLIINFFKKDK